ncbi:hypothetical protein ElyMa_004523600 [Elysia marginata]|uniref:Uncharacterized protein n=1 Tax=Elysia marginata TaxID=1093978 RepID=A0AAV4HNJ6_9GAST|nr:hypothetical protein ElyMa_004523600 [Elysia marginata]
MKNFAEKTFVKHFFNTAPPFKLTDRSGVLWDTEFKGLLRTTVDEDGNIVKKPTIKFSHIKQYTAEIVNGAYASLEVPSGTYHASKEEKFIDLITRFSRYAEAVNNISADTSFNASSFILWYFKTHSTSSFTFEDFRDSLTDIEGGSMDVEEVILVNHLGRLNYIEDSIDDAVKDPRNIVTLAGDPYELIRPALKCKYVLLKTLFWLVWEIGPMSLRSFVCDLYRKRFDMRYPSVHNVLQIFPGLLTFVMYVLQDARGINPPACAGRIVTALNHKMIVAYQMKGAGGRRAATMRQNEVSAAVMSACELFLDLADKIPSVLTLRQYVSEVFLRSGFIKPSDVEASHLSG